MGIQQMALLSVALNLDMFGVSLLIGTMISRAKIILPMSMIVAFFLTLMPLTGYGIGNAIGKLIGPVSSYIGAGLLIIVGIELIREAYFSSISLLNSSNLILLYLGAGLDELTAGASLGMQSSRILLFLALFYCSAFVINFIAFHLGKMLRKYINFPIGYFAGVILIGMGIVNFLHLF